MSKETWRFFSPQTPSPMFTPERLASRVMWVFAGQYCEGRKCTSESFIQFHTPSVGVDVVTTRWLSTAALSATGSSKYTRIGMPTPRVMPPSGPIDGVETLAGVTVVKVEEALASSSAVFFAVADRV